jgi:ABC-type multidrug transport system ATPase subunit
LLTAPNHPAAAVPEKALPAVELQGIAKLFGRFAALRDVSAGFAAGKLYAVIGENGAGKSTLLRIIAGLADPTRGKARILGATPREAAPRIGYMAHSSMLYDELSGLENLRYFARLYSGLRSLSEQDLQRSMESVGLDPRLERRASAYSQGMRQRLSLARALLHSPELLLLDEPFSNVDSASSAAMAALLEQLRDSGTTIFVVTHQREMLARIVDEFVTLHAGVITERSTGAGAAR